MGENSAIEWTDHTFNPWVGCTKVSPACQHCYAESWAKRSGLVEWGDSAPRRRTSEANWKNPLKWNREAALRGERKRVFCASLADAFEDRPELTTWRSDLFRLIESTSNLDWLLLTKRPENIWRFSRGMPKTVWLGTTVESADYLTRVHSLLECEHLASVLFLSCEPLLGPLNLNAYLNTKFMDSGCYAASAQIDWVIAGGESGGGFRALNVDYVRQLRDQCAAAGVPFFFKQHGGPTAKSGGCLLDGREWKEFPKAA